jgi:hypothetical protein
MKTYPALSKVHGTSRETLAFVICCGLVALQLHDTTKLLKSSVFLLPLCIGFIILSRLSKRRETNGMFSSFVSVFSMGVSLEFCLLAHGFCPQETATSMDSLMLARMDKGSSHYLIFIFVIFHELPSHRPPPVSGELPIPMFFAIVLPIIAVPCGMNVDHVKISMCVNVLLLSRTSLTLWQRSPDCQLGIFHDFVAYAIMSVLCWYCSVPSSEETRFLVKDLEVGRSADSVLTRESLSALQRKLCTKGS